MTKGCLFGFFKSTEGSSVGRPLLSAGIHWGYLNTANLRRKLPTFWPNIDWVYRGTKEGRKRDHRTRRTTKREGQTRRSKREGPLWTNVTTAARNDRNQRRTRTNDGAKSQRTQCPRRVLEAPACIGYGNPRLGRRALVICHVAPLLPVELSGGVIC